MCSHHQVAKPHSGADEWFHVEHGRDRPVFGADTTIDRYVEILTSRGVDRGLVGPREAPRIWQRHIWNSAVVESELPAHSSVCDVGSGAGLPGLVLAIARPDLTVTLLEPLQRRADFLREVVDELGLPHVRVVRGRAEEHPAGRAYEIVTARAVAPLDRLARWCRRLGGDGSILLAIKGRRARAELDAAEPVLARDGWGRAEIRELGAGVVEPPTAVIRLEFPCAGATKGAR